MNQLKRGIWLIFVLLAIARNAVTQVPTTTVQDTVYYANGTPAQGTIVLSWNAFITANGAAIAAGNTTVTLGTGGSLTVALAPNLGSTPMGNFYTAVYHLNDGETSREFWVVPAFVPGGGPAKLAGIRNQVLPTSVAMQTVTKQYVDDEILAAEIAPIPLSSSPYVLKSGDTMTGPFTADGGSGGGPAVVSIVATHAGGADYTWASSALDAGMLAGQHLIHFIGQSTATNDAGYVAFQFNPTTTNLMTIGFAGVGDVASFTPGGGYIGPVAAPSGSCITNGTWIFSQDGHATFCASGTWVTKI